MEYLSHKVSTFPTLLSTLSHPYLPLLLLSPLPLPPPPKNFLLELIKREEKLFEQNNSNKEGNICLTH